jgi:type II secretory ATPase GspE/PulE/Tfp pilus assembly ATPase PilB-like protein
MSALDNRTLVTHSSLHSASPLKPMQQLTIAQQKLYELVVVEKQSLFFTGPAGSGKSCLFKTMIGDIKLTAYPD